MEMVARWLQDVAPLDQPHLFDENVQWLPVSFTPLRLPSKENDRTFAYNSSCGWHMHITKLRNRIGVENGEP